MKVYIAGPVTGLPEDNRPAFNDAARLLREAGHEPINPTRDEGREGCVTWLDFMRAALRDVAEADGIALLCGWDQSRGATIEAGLGVRLGLDVRRIDGWSAES